MDFWKISGFDHAREEREEGTSTLIKIETF